MAFKLLEECQTKWRKINVPEEIKNLLAGLEYREFVVRSSSSHHEATGG